VLTLEAGNALEVAQTLTDALPQSTSQTAQTLYTALVGAAIETARGKGYSPAVTHMIFHCPLEQVARACGLSRKSVWRHLPALRDLGLVDWRTHKGTCRGETRNTGTVWKVRLTPTHGTKARLGYQDLKHRWRDLDADVRAGRTSYALLSHTSQVKTKSVDIAVVTSWTLLPQAPQNPVGLYGTPPRRVDLESVLDVRHADRGERGGAVDLAAQALAQALRDSSSLNYYRRLLWQLLRRYDATGEDLSYQVYLMAQRARTDATEGFARKPGALFLSRLKKADWFAEIMNASPIRVGSRPLSV
jgi:hypothetical protein